MIFYSCLSQNNTLNEIKRILQSREEAFVDSLKTIILTKDTQNWISDYSDERPEYFKECGITNLKNKTNILREIN